MNYEYPAISQPTASIEDWFTTETYRSPFGYINDPYAGKRFDYLYQGDPIDNPVGSYNYTPSAKGDYAYLSTGLDETTGYQKVGPYTPKINYGAGVQRVMTGAGGQPGWGPKQQKYADRFGQYFSTMEDKIGAPIHNIELLQSHDPNSATGKGGYIFKASTQDGKQYIVEMPHSPGGGFFDYNTSGMPGWKSLGLGDLGGEGNERIPGSSSASYIPIEQFKGLPGSSIVSLANVNPQGSSGLGALGGLLGAGIGLATGMPFLGSAIGALSDGELSGGDLLGLGLSGIGAAGGLDGLFGGAAGTGGSMFEGLGDWFSNLFSSGSDTASGMLGSVGSGASEFASSIASAADPIEAMYQTMAATGTTSVTDAAAALGFNSANAMLGAINPSWLSAGSSFLTDAAKQAVNKLTSSGGAGGLLSGGLQALGGYLSGNAAQDAAKTSAQAQIEAARIAADAAKFKPVGVTTRFGKSQFTKDAQGNVVSAGYNVSPDIKAMQDSLIGIAPGMLSQFTGSQAATAPMGVGAQRAMSLGNQYLNTDPMAQAKKYYDDQQAIMATGRARDQAGALTGEFNRGTYGLATGATGMMGAANPRLEAMYNAQRQQDLQAAANATQGGMDYAKFGAGLVGTGGNMLRDMYGTQTAAYSPFATAMTGAQNIEGLGQNALDMSINIGKTASPAQAGSLLGQGMLGAAQTMQQANQYSPWGTALMNAGNALNTMQQPQQQQTSGYMFNPFTGVRL